MNNTPNHDVEESANQRRFAGWLAPAHVERWASVWSIVE